MLRPLTTTLAAGGLAVALFLPFPVPLLLPLSPATSPAAQAPALDDATIVAIFDLANTRDIETGRLAAAKAHAPEVRRIGEALVRDHENVRQQGRDLARRLGVTPTPPKPDPDAAEHARAMASLREKSGAEFDRAFLEHEIAYHQAVIDAVTTTLLPAIRNAELKAFVQKIAPAFQAHLDLVKAAQRQLAATPR